MRLRSRSWVPVESDVGSRQSPSYLPGCVTQTTYEGGPRATIEAHSEEQLSEAEPSPMSDSAVSGRAQGRCRREQHHPSSSSRQVRFLRLTEHLFTSSRPSPPIPRPLRPQPSPDGERRHTGSKTGQALSHPGADRALHSALPPPRLGPFSWHPHPRILWHSWERQEQARLNRGLPPDGDLGQRAHTES